MRGARGGVVPESGNPESARGSRAEVNPSRLRTMPRALILSLSANPRGPVPDPELPREHDRRRASGPVPAPEHGHAPGPAREGAPDERGARTQAHQQQPRTARAARRAAEAAVAAVARAALERRAEGVELAAVERRALRARMAERRADGAAHEHTIREDARSVDRERRTAGRVLVRAGQERAALEHDLSARRESRGARRGVHAAALPLEQASSDDQPAAVACALEDPPRRAQPEHHQAVEVHFLAGLETVHEELADEGRAALRAD